MSSHRLFKSISLLLIFASFWQPISWAELDLLRARAHEERESEEKAKRVLAARNYLISLGANFDELSPPREPKSFYGLLLDPSSSHPQLEPQEDYEHRMVSKIQRLSRLLKTAIGIHVMPSRYLPTLTTEDFEANSMLISPAEMKGLNILNNNEQALRYFIEFGQQCYGLFGFGYRTRTDRQAIPSVIRASIPAGSPSVPIILFVKIWGRTGEPMPHIFLSYRDPSAFEDKLLGLLQWKFEEIDGKSTEQLKREIAERYLDKLLEIAGSVATVDTVLPDTPESPIPQSPAAAITALASI